jgi:hypothetical protein
LNNYFKDLDDELDYNSDDDLDDNDIAVVSHNCTVFANTERNKSVWNKF